MKSNDPYAITRSSVLERAKNGDADEFARIYSPLVYRMARKRGLSDVNAEDIMQQVMMELLKLLPRFHYDRKLGTFKGLLKKIVSNRSTDYLRRIRPSLGVDALAQVPVWDEELNRQFEREWQKAHLMAALDRIRNEVKESTFKSFELYVLAGKPIEEVTQSLGLSANQISQNKSRIVQRIKRHIQEMQNDTPS